MAKIDRISIYHFAKFQAFLTILLGFVLGIIYSFGGLIIDSLVTIGLVDSNGASTPGLSIGTVYAFGALIGMPMICGVTGFVAGVIEAVLYNLYAKFFGGLDEKYVFPNSSS